MWKKDEYGGLMEWHWQEKTEVPREKTSLVPVFSPEIPHSWPGIELEPSR